MAVHSVRRLLGFGAVLIVALAADCKNDEPFVPTVTTITVSPNAKAFHALTATQQFSASVLDQRGNPMTGVSVTWSSSAATIASVNGAGLVTANAAGSANIVATSGTISGQAAVTVTQLAASLFKYEGDAQSAGVGQQLQLVVTARVLDSANSPVPGIAVAFAAGSGGSVGTPNTTSNASGFASTTWRLGNTAGPQQLTASSTGLTSVVFVATALSAPPDTVIKATTDASNVPAGTAVFPSPAVLLRDSLGNPVPGVAVTFSLTSGGGLLSGATQTSNASGFATVGQWIVGTGGAQTLTATAGSIPGSPITFNATVLSPGAPATITVSSANPQTGLQGYAVNVPPAAVVRDAANNPVQGVSVTFAPSAGSSVTGGTATTDLQGVARVGSWTIANGANTLTATASGVGTPATYNATGVAPAFNIQVRYLTTVTPAQQAAFDSAAARWSRVIFGDIPDVVVNPPAPAGSCGRPEVPAINETIDDLVIFAILEPIDGVNNILGSAGPCATRSAGSQLPLWGLMRFDTADLANMESNGTLRDVILHEMGHVLGLGTRWQAKGLLSGAGGSDPFFTGAEARAAFDQIGGTAYTGGGKVPVENCVGTPGPCGGSTRDGHWRETSFDDELMTGYITGPVRPLSIVTSAQYIDMGYQVNLAASDAFAVAAPFLVARAAGPLIALGDDILRTPILVIDEAGRVTRVIQPR